MTDRNVVDSSAWLEHLVGASRARLFATAIEDTNRLVVPVICLAEVLKTDSPPPTTANRAHGQTDRVP
ncbi:MAG: hypothetical protein HY719_06605 [Planctomycetes bacterium]|nr:hypothetical protein [Planctomycetota bacterium]